ncbi:MAG: HNH endonuclease [Acidimicrobiia bacterium]|nr:HNH endonuclease [Acidimicrobiia bacterium]
MGRRAEGRRTTGRRSSPARPPRSSLDRRARMTLILERDGPRCVWCASPFDDRLNRATTEHLVPRIKGGPSWLENEVAACKRCNGRRGHRNLVDWADECDGSGWNVDRHRLIRVLESLDARIAEQGGQRRARPYIRSQLRRLRRQIS